MVLSALAGREQISFRIESYSGDTFCVAGESAQNCGCRRIPQLDGIVFRAGGSNPSAVRTESDGFNVIGRGERTEDHKLIAKQTDQCVDPDSSGFTPVGEFEGRGLRGELGCVCGCASR